jgi:hypothetical protein
VDVRGLAQVALGLLGLLLGVLLLVEWVQTPGGPLESLGTNPWMPTPIAAVLTLAVGAGTTLSGCLRLRR